MYETYLYETYMKPICLTIEHQNNKYYSGMFSDIYLYKPSRLPFKQSFISQILLYAPLGYR